MSTIEVRISGPVKSGKTAISVLLMQQLEMLGIPVILYDEDRIVREDLIFNQSDRLKSVKENGTKIRIVQLTQNKESIV